MATSGRRPKRARSGRADVVEERLHDLLGSPRVPGAERGDVGRRQGPVRGVDGHRRHLVAKL